MVGGRSLGLVPGFILAGTWSVPLSGTQGPGSFPKAGRNDTGISCDLHISVRVFIPEMKAESGLSPDSSSIGSRVRSSKVKDAVAPSVSMDSSDSSLDLTTVVEDPKAIVARNVSPVAEGNRYPPIGPPSVIGVEEVADWRMKYNLPADIIIRVPGLEDRVSDFGVDEVPGSSPFFGGQDIGNLGDFPSGAKWRYYLRPRGKEPPIREVPKRERKRLPAFAGNWTENFAFMRLPGFLPIWQLEGRLAVGVTKVLQAKKVLIVSCFLDEYLPRVDYSSGRETIERVLRLPIERCQIPFPVSKAALKRCSIWGEMSGSKGDEALTKYKKALEVMSARKSAPKRAASVDDDEVQFLRSSKRLTVAATVSSSSKKKSKASGSSPSASYDWTTVLTNLNTKVASQLFHLGERMVGAASTKAEMDALASQLREEKDVVLANDKEIKALRLKARNQEEAGELAATENVSLRGQLKNMEEELNDLKDTAETFEAEKAMAVNGTKVVARWELMREWLNGQTDSWDPANVLEQYKMVKITEAELLGLPTPSFEGEPQVPGDMEGEKTPEPAADDPPAS
ncbi:hypothetical protein HID58_087176 [Brassica napus]|uniref:Uncharacterized protein n=1 Tax=Brassica napus TaxID=3708 RepID=A0ABQ7XVG8_BRANA|nr:hypothetical protein HID58_087176 [Brassica napus]